MTETRYQLIFSGRLRPEVHPEQARQAVKERFKLKDALLDRLFSGQRVTVKRNLDSANAERYQRAFATAGVQVELEPTPTTAERQVMKLLPPGSPIGEQPAFPETPPPDTSHLRLAPSEATSLEDCAPPPAVPPPLDLSALELVPLDPSQQRE